MMRIITGTAKGKRLATLEGDATRPTSERIKGAIFSSIQFELEGRVVLDLFAGSGQMGLEALSRGADVHHVYSYTYSRAHVSDYLCVDRTFYRFGTFGRR